MYNLSDTNVSPSNSRRGLGRSRSGLNQNAKTFSINIRARWNWSDWKKREILTAYTDFKPFLRGHFAVVLYYGTRGSAVPDDDGETDAFEMFIIIDKGRERTFSSGQVFRKVFPFADVNRRFSKNKNHPRSKDDYYYFLNVKKLTKTRWRLVWSLNAAR